MSDYSLDDFTHELVGFHGRRKLGRVAEIIGLTVAVNGLVAERGETVEIYASRQTLLGEVVGFRDEQALVMPLGDSQGLKPGTEVRALGVRLQVPSGDALLGRVLDGLGRPLDRPGEKILGAMRELDAEPPSPLERMPIDHRLGLGIRAFDTLIPCGRGQRLGIFAGSGVGKSSLLGMIARGSSAQVNVICLVGERGREVQEFIEDHLGEGINRSVVVAATSDRPALERVKALATATAIAEGFRDQGKDVLLLCDSLTRLAMAQREIGLAVGEPPATRGYPPSVWSILPQLLERAGRTQRGSITGLYTVLVEGDDMNEPIADAARAILDGHLVLSRELAHRNHYPAIDILESVSRLQSSLLPSEVLQAGGQLRELLAALRSRQDMIALGAYQAGTEPQVDRAIHLRESMDSFLRQNQSDLVPAETADAQLLEILNQPEMPPLEPAEPEAPVMPTLSTNLL